MHYKKALVRSSIAKCFKFLYFIVEIYGSSNFSAAKYKNHPNTQTHCRTAFKAELFSDKSVSKNNKNHTFNGSSKAFKSENMGEFSNFAKEENGLFKRENKGEC